MLLALYIDDLIQSGQIDKTQIELNKNSNSINFIHAGNKLYLSRLLLDTKVLYSDSNKGQEEKAALLVSAFTPTNAKKYEMSQIANWKKCFNIINAFMEFNNIMQAKQDTKEIERYTSQKLKSFTQDWSEAEKKKMQKNILGTAIVYTISEIEAIYDGPNTPNITLNKDPEEAIVELLSKYPGQGNKVKEYIDQTINEVFHTHKINTI